MDYGRLDSVLMISYYFMLFLWFLRSSKIVGTPWHSHCWNLVPWYITTVPNGLLSRTSNEVVPSFGPTDSGKTYDVREWGTCNLPICQFAMHVSWLNPWILDSNLPTCNLNGATPPCRHRSSCTAWGLALARRPSMMASPVVRGHCLWEGEPVCRLLLVFMGSKMSHIILDAAPGRKCKKSVRTTCPMLLAFVERLGSGHSVGHSGYACVLSLACRKPFFLADLGAGVCKSAWTHLGPSKILNWNEMRRRDQKDIKHYQTMFTKNSSTEWCVDWMETTFRPFTRMHTLNYFHQSQSQWSCCRSSCSLGSRRLGDPVVPCCPTFMPTLWGFLTCLEACSGNVSCKSLQLQRFFLGRKNHST